MGHIHPTMTIWKCLKMGYIIKLLKFQSFRLDVTWKLELKWMPLCEKPRKNAAYTQIHALVDLPNSAVESIRSISGNPTFSTRASSITMYYHVLPCMIYILHIPKLYFGFILWSHVTFVMTRQARLPLLHLDWSRRSNLRPAETASWLQRTKRTMERRDSAGCDGQPVLQPPAASSYFFLWMLYRSPLTWNHT